jgi:hypothetical protein
MDAKLHAFDFAAGFPLEVHVKMPQIQLGELPLQGGGFYSQVAQGAHGHVSADTRKTVKIEGFHTG